MVLRWVIEVGGVVGVCPGLEMRARTLLRWMDLVAPVRLPYKGVHIERGAERQDNYMVIRQLTEVDKVIGLGLVPLPEERRLLG